MTGCALARFNYLYIDAPCLAHGGHGASLRHHKRRIIGGRRRALPPLATAAAATGASEENG
eukprot:COSAG01_NODE_61478_length_289_cov_1.068421_1_plen_60_part_01